MGLLDVSTDYRRRRMTEAIAAAIFVMLCFGAIAWAYKKDMQNFDEKYNKSNNHYRDKDHT